MRFWKGFIARYENCLRAILSWEEGGKKKLLGEIFIARALVFSVTLCGTDSCDKNLS